MTNLNTERRVRESHYFQFRSHGPDETRNLPKYISDQLPKNKGAIILDIGCGMGEYLSSLMELGYTNAKGIDIATDAIEHCVRNGLAVERVSDIRAYFPKQRCDFFIMNHVLEHVDKDDIIDTLAHVRENVMSTEGRGIIVVPNAQALTGAYWAYEDFTHSLLFTTGSLRYVLLAAGFSDVGFTDLDATLGSRFATRLAKKILLTYLKLSIAFWNRVSSSAFHKQSQQSLAFEIKAVVGR